MEESIQTASKEERNFEEFMQHGDDFFKIELWRPAKAWYGKALKFGIETDRVKIKIEECNRQIAYELKVIRILVAITIVIVLLLLIF